jgi:hypothetical protein
MDHAPFRENIKIEIPGPPLQCHATTPHQHDATTPSVQSSTVLIKHNNLYSLMPHLLTVLGIPIQRGPGAIIARPVWQEMAYTRYYWRGHGQAAMGTWSSTPCNSCWQLNSWWKLQDGVKCNSLRRYDFEEFLPKSQWVYSWNNSMAALQIYPPLGMANKLGQTANYLAFWSKSNK